MLLRLDEVRRRGVDLGLDRVRAALGALGSPDRRFMSAQIAGTNGKGSTAAMTESILRASGLRTGLFTSPHLSRFSERVRIDGREIDGERLAHFDAQIEATGIPLTYFEVSALLAALAFADAGVEVAVLETGLGGRLDAVTAFAVQVTAITSIGLDHTDVLGPGLAHIAREKAGIARPGVPLLIGDLSAVAEAEIVRQAANVGAPVRRIVVDPSLLTVVPALLGPHQIANACLAVQLAHELTTRVRRPLPPSAIAQGLTQVRWPGRMEWLADNLLLDAAHNQEGGEALARALQPLAAQGRPFAFVLSMVRNKDAEGFVAALLALASLMVVTASHNERSRPAGELVTLVRAQAPGIDVRAEQNPLAAVEAARAWANDRGGIVVVTGSIFLVAQVRAAWLGDPVDPVDPSRSGDPMP